MAPQRGRANYEPLMSAGAGPDYSFLILTSRRWDALTLRPHFRGLTMRNFSPVLIAAMIVAFIVIAGCASRSQPAATQVEAPSPPPAPSSAPTPAPTSAPPRFDAMGSLQQRFAAEAGERVYFALDSVTLNAEARAVLDRQASWLAANPAVAILVAGNCDERGTREYNIALGARRAQATADYLAARGVQAGRIRTISYGKERPIDAGSDDGAWSRNRNAHTLVEG